MQAFVTNSVQGAIQWLEGCAGLGATSRGNLVSVLRSPRFEAALRQYDGSRIVIEYQEDATTDRRPRRVLLEEAIRHRRVAVITADRGAWLLSATPAAAG